MRSVNIWVGGTSVGQKQRTSGYPDARDKRFWIPIYPCTVSGTNNAGQLVNQKFNVLRFGVQVKNGRPPTVVGLADAQSYKIKAWLPEYKVHSAPSDEDGAWHVFDNFLIHDGPDNPNDIFATIGCIEIMGERGFVKFNDLIIELSGATAGSRDSKLNQIGRSGNLVITYQASRRPPLEEA